MKVLEEVSNLVDFKESVKQEIWASNSEARALSTWCSRELDSCSRLTEIPGTCVLESMEGRIKRTL